MSHWDPDLYTRAWNFAADAHGDQKVPGSSRPYINHVANVAMEVLNALARTEGVTSPDLAVQCALLHDVLEDTPTRHEELESTFGTRVARGVQALTKDGNLETKALKMQDSLDRIREQPLEVWMVKMADRISNLQPPPAHWSLDKCRAYQDEARRILEALGEANPYLSDRLEARIQAYGDLLDAR